MSDIQHAAEAVASARTAAGIATRKLNEAVAHRDRIVERIAALDEQRTEMVAALRAGGDKAELGATLLIVDADREDLSKIRHEADNAVNAVTPEVARANRAIVLAEQNFARAVDGEELGRLIDHAGQLDQLLLATLERIATLYKALGIPRPQFYPSDGLANIIQRLSLTKGMIR